MIFTIPKRHNEMKINKVGLLVIVFFGVTRKYNADIMVVIAFGQILPKEILELPRLEQGKPRRQLVSDRPDLRRYPQCQERKDPA